MEKPIAIAGRLGHENLYHYQPFDADRLIDILRNSRVFCSNPASFNDPWDCKPYFDLDVIDDPATHQRIAEQLIASQKGGSKGDPTDELLRRDPHFLKTVMHEFNMTFADFVPKRWAVYCIGKSADTSLMWSHYGNNHTGLCLEFAVQSTPFAYAFEVHYQEEYPIFQFHDTTAQIKMLITKSDVWNYEEEFRLVCPRTIGITPEHPLIIKDDYLPIGPGTLRSVIVGCQATNFDAVNTLVMQHAPHVSVKRAVRAPNKYRLAITD